MSNTSHCKHRDSEAMTLKKIIILHKNILNIGLVLAINKVELYFQQEADMRTP